MFNKLLAATLIMVVVLSASANVTHTRNEDFSVEPGARIEVKINGGPIDVKIGTSDKVHVELVQTAQTGSEKEADEWIASDKSIIEKTSRGVRVVADPEHSHGWSWFSNHDRVYYRVNVTVPATVNLDLDTSGGPIEVSGEIHGDLRANTSGGPIRVTGATGKIDVDTSGGGISVEHVVTQVHADTSGGPIHIGYVDAAATDIDADTSGGGIDIGLDPAGNYDVHGDTSGGSVSISDLTVDIVKKGSSHLEARINHGGTRVRADTSGGNINIHAAQR